MTHDSRVSILASFANVLVLLALLAPAPAAAQSGNEQPRIFGVGFLVDSWQLFELDPVSGSVSRRGAGIRVDDAGAGFPTLSVVGGVFDPDAGLVYVQVESTGLAGPSGVAEDHLAVLDMNSGDAVRTAPLSSFVDGLWAALHPNRGTIISSAVTTVEEQARYVIAGLDPVTGQTTFRGDFGIPWRGGPGSQLPDRSIDGGWLDAAANVMSFLTMGRSGQDATQEILHVSVVTGEPVGRLPLALRYWSTTTGPRQK